MKYIRYVERSDDYYKHKQFGGNDDNASGDIDKGVIYITKEFDKIFNDIILRLKCCHGDMNILAPMNPNHKKFIGLVKQLYETKIKELEMSNEYKNYKEWHFDTQIIAGNTQLTVKNVIIKTPKQYIDHFMKYYVPLTYKLFDFAIQLINEIKYFSTSNHIPIYSVPSYRAFLNNRANLQYKNILANDGYAHFTKELICSLDDGGDECYIFNIMVYLGKFPLLGRELLEKLSLSTQQITDIAKFKEQTATRTMEINELQRSIETHNANITNKYLKPKEFNACVIDQSKYKTLFDKECKSITDSDIDEAKKCKKFKQWKDENAKKCQPVYQNANKQREEDYGNMRIPNQYSTIQNEHQKLSIPPKQIPINNVPGVKQNIVPKQTMIATPIEIKPQPKSWYKFW